MKKFQLHAKFIYTPPFRNYNTNTDWTQFSILTNDMSKPKLYIENTAEIDTAIQNFQASIKTALRNASTSTSKRPYNLNSNIDDTLNDYLRHKRTFLKLYRQFGSPCYKALYNKYTRLVKDHLRVKRSEF